MSDYAYGLHAVTALLEGDREAVRTLWVLRRRKDHRLERILKAARGAGVPVHEVERRELDERVAGARHQGIVAQCDRQAPLTEVDLDTLLRGIEGVPLLLILDGVQDPHNLGACLRSAEAAGAHAVIAPRNRATGLTPVVRKVASGAAERVPFIQVTNLVRTLEFLKQEGIWLVGLAGEGSESLYDVDLAGPAGMLLGAEGGGLRRLTREHCDILARIPMQGQAESLNVSVAAGVALFEALRQRIPRG